MSSVAQPGGHPKPTIRGTQAGCGAAYLRQQTAPFKQLNGLIEIIPAERERQSLLSEFSKIKRINT